MIFAFNKEKALVHRWSGTSELVETLRTFFSMLMLVETLRTFFSTLMLACGNTSIFLLNFDAEHLPWAFSALMLVETLRSFFSMLTPYTVHGPSPGTVKFREVDSSNHQVPE